MMRRLKIFMCIFFLALVVPLGYLVWTTIQGMEHEERAEMAFFAGELFDKIEDELAALIEREESRSVEEFNSLLMDEDQRRPGSAPSYVLGYLQNNPDGSFQPPLHLLMAESSVGRQDRLLAGQPQATREIYLEKEEESGTGDLAAAEDGTRVSMHTTVVVRSGPDGEDAMYARIIVGDDTAMQGELSDSEVMGELEELLTRLRDADTVSPEKDEARSSLEEATEPEMDKQASVAERYLDMSEEEPRPSLGRQERRVEQIPAESLNMTMNMQASPHDGWMDEGAAQSPDTSAMADLSAESGAEPIAPVIERDLDPEPEERNTNALFEVEVAPYQSVFINDQLVYMFRRIVVDNTIYRQGFVIKINELLTHLAVKHFAGQPMAGFARLSLAARAEEGLVQTVSAGAEAGAPTFVLNRSFPRPFDFLGATLASQTLPPSSGRSQLTALVSLLSAIILLGLFTIYKSARVVMDHSARRTGFVSSVTHELKTPLTNIRMYVEMLEMGMARDPEREQEYLRIVSSESARLSRLINNVLEYSRLENNQRKVELVEGDFNDVMDEVREVMHEKVRQDGFTLHLDNQRERPFLYNAEIMTQVLINLVENSLKFGKHSPVREIAIRVTDEGRDEVRIAVVDSGPGIPKHALPRIFDDFYRVDDTLTRRTRGTGIGLALVRKLIQAMGGRVEADNNNGPGLTVSVILPE